MVDQFQGKVRSTALSMVQDVEQAEDITQDVFVSVFKSILSFNEKSSLSTWIYRITINKCLDYHRSKKQKYQKNSETLNVNNPLENRAEYADFVHPGATTENREKSVFLFKAINQLPENQKTAFVLVFVEDLSQKETAEVMNMSIKAVESLLQRAKGNLRKWLNDHYT